MTAEEAYRKSTEVLATNVSVMLMSIQDQIEQQVAKHHLRLDYNFEYTNEVTTAVIGRVVEQLKALKYTVEAKNQHDVNWLEISWKLC